MSQDAKFLTLNRWGNPNAPFDIGNCVAFADAAGTAPVDGTGGAPAVTIARSTATPLDGVASFLFTKDAANRQGQGFSGDVILQPDDATKMFTLSYDYQLTTGTYTGYQAPPLFSDLTMWVYDVTNAVMYQVMGYQVDGTISTTNQYSFQGQWQVPVGCLQARVIWFLGNTTTVAFTARFNNITFGRLPRAQGMIGTSPQSYAVGTSGMGTVTGASFAWSRINNRLFGEGVFITGTVAASLAWITLPGGANPDISLAYGSSCYIAGRWQEGSTAGTYGNLLVSGLTSSLNGGGLLYFTRDAFTGLQGVPANGNSALENSVKVEVKFDLPILGWGANGTLGQDAATQVIIAQATGNAASATSGNPLIFPTVSFDTVGGYSNSTGRFTCPVAGFYKIYGALLSANAGIGLNIYKNAVSGPYAGATDSNGESTFSSAVQALAGDLIDLRPNGTLDPSDGSINFERISGPAQVQAPDVPKSGYNTNAAQSINNATTAIVDFEDKIYDTYGLVTVGTWKFTCPRAGVVRVSSLITYASGVFTLNNTIKLFLYKNGALYETLDYVTVMATVTDPLSCNGSTEVQVIAGDFLDVRTSHGEATARALTSTNTENYIAVSYTDGGS